MQRPNDVSTPSVHDVTPQHTDVDALFAELGPFEAPLDLRVSCVTPPAYAKVVAEALRRLGIKVWMFVAAAPEGTSSVDLEQELLIAEGHATDAHTDLALAFGDSPDRIAVSYLQEERLVRLESDETLKLAFNWLLNRKGAFATNLTIVSAIGTNPSLDDLAMRAGARLVRTLPSRVSVEQEMAYQRTSDNTHPVIGAISEASLLVAEASGASGSIALALAILGAAADAKRRGRDLSNTLEAIDAEIGCWKVAHVTEHFDTFDHAPLLLMRLRKDERKLICHMVVADTIDYFSGVPVPGDPTRKLPFFDAVSWKLSDGSALIVYADEQASCAHAICLVRADTRAEAQAVSWALAAEAHEILTSKDAQENSCS